MKKVYIETMGCQMNKSDAERMYGMLEHLGYYQTEEPKEADMLIINTCSVRQLSEDEFVLKMEEHDLKEMTSVKIAHDYVQIGANMGIQVECGDWKPYGKFASCVSNWIKGYFDIQINIITYNFY